MWRERGKAVLALAGAFGLGGLVVLGRLGASSSADGAALPGWAVLPAGSETRRFWVAADGSAWAVGDKTLLRFDGRGWSRVSVPGAQDFRFDTVWGSGPGDVWIAGDVRRRFLDPVDGWPTTEGTPKLFRWDGHRLAEVPRPAPAAGALTGVQEIGGTGRDDVWFVAPAVVEGRAFSGHRHHDFQMETVRSPELLHWNGAGLERCPLPDQARPRVIASASPEDVWVGSERGLLRYAGCARPLPQPRGGWGPYQSVEAILARSPRDVWASSGGLWRWEGTRWTQVPPGPGGSLGVTAMWSAGNRLFAIEHQGRRFLTLSDGGWVPALSLVPTRAHWSNRGFGGDDPARIRLAARWGDPAPLPRVIDGEPGDAEAAASLQIPFFRGALAPGGRFVLLHSEYGDDTNRMVLVALPGGEVVRVVPGPDFGLEDGGIALAPDGRWALFAGKKRDVLVWDLQRGRKRATLVGGGHREEIKTVAVAPGGRLAASADDDGVVVLWNVATGRPVRRFAAGENGAGEALGFSPDGRRLFSAGGDVVVFDRDSGRKVLELVGRPVRRVAFTPDGRRIVATSRYDGFTTVSDARTGRLLALREKNPLPDELIITPDGRAIIGTDGPSLVRWRLDDLKVERELANPGVEEVVGLAAGGRVMFSAGEEGLRRWDVATGRRLPGTGRAITALAWTPDGRHLVEGASDGTVTVRGARGQVLRRSARHDGGVGGLVISPDGALAASAAADGVVVLWKLPAGAERVLEPKDGADELAWVTFSSDGKRLLAGDVQSIHAWEVASGKEIASPESCNPPIQTGMGAPVAGGAMLVATGSWERYWHGAPDSDERGNTLALLDLTSCLPRWKRGPVAKTAMAVAPGGAQALVGDRKGALTLIGMTDGRELQDLVPGQHDGARVLAAAFLNATLALVGDTAGQLVLWDVARGEALRRFPEPRARRSVATAIAARPDGRGVAVGTSRGEVLIYAW